MLDLHAHSLSDVMSAERRGVFGDLWLSRFLQSGEDESQCGWCVVLSFAYLSPSQSWSSSLWVSFAFFWSGSAVKKLVFYCVFIFQLDQIKFFLFFTVKVMDWPQNTFNHFYFLTNFIDISLCADPMHRSPIFHFEESLSTGNIQWMLLWTLVGIIILCVR